MSRRVDQSSATCRVFTFKEGLLSAIAHDLEIDVGRFSITWDEQKIEATFETSSLRVLHPMANGRPNPSALSDRDQRKIEQTMRDEVLQVARHPTVRFTCTTLGDGDARTLNGTLSLSGRERALPVRVQKDGARWIAEATIHQPDFGMKPYTAMLGTLRIQADVRVRLEVPA